MHHPPTCTVHHKGAATALNVMVRLPLSPPMHSPARTVHHKGAAAALNVVASLPSPPPPMHHPPACAVHHKGTATALNVVADLPRAHEIGDAVQGEHLNHVTGEVLHMGGGMQCRVSTWTT